MPRRKKFTELPDLRPPRHTVGDVQQEVGKAIARPTPEAIALIARKHKFPPTFDLVHELITCWFFWRLHVHNWPEITGATRRKLLLETAKRAEALEEAADKLGAEEWDAIRRYDTTKKFDAQSLKRQLDALRRGASWGASATPPSRRGARGNRSLIQLLCMLYRLWMEAFGAAAPRISKTDVYGKGYFAFANDVLQSFGVKKSNAGLGKAVEKAMRTVDQRIETGRLSPE